MLIGWTVASAPWHLFVLGFLLGIAGASFAVALPLASRWYPARYQGLADGNRRGWNSGPPMATLFAPRLAERIGWAGTFGLAILPVACVTLLFMPLAKDTPAATRAPGWKDYTEILREPDSRGHAVGHFEPSR